MENTRADELRGPLFADTPELGDLGGGGGGSQEAEMQK